MIKNKWVNNRRLINIYLKGLIAYIQVNLHSKMGNGTLDNFIWCERYCRFSSFKLFNSVYFYMFSHKKMRMPLLKRNHTLKWSDYESGIVMKGHLKLHLQLRVKERTNLSLETGIVSFICPTIPLFTWKCAKQLNIISKYLIK